MKQIIPAVLIGILIGLFLAGVYWQAHYLRVYNREDKCREVVRIYGRGNH